MSNLLPVNLLTLLAVFGATADLQGATIRLSDVECQQSIQEIIVDGT